MFRGGLGSVEYKVGYEVFRATATQVLGSTLWRSKHTGQLNENIKWLLLTKHELPKSSHLQSLAQQLKRSVAVAVGFFT